MKYEKNYMCLWVDNSGKIKLRTKEGDKITCYRYLKTCQLVVVEMHTVYCQN
jgi:hypothetical protein